MATATEISTAALKRLNVVEASSTPAAADVDDANLALNRMISSWGTRAINVTLPLDAVFDHWIIALLAVRLAEDYGKEPGPVLVQDAKDGWRLLKAAFTTIPNSTFDISLTGGSVNSQAYPAGSSASTDTLSFGDTVITWS